MSTLKLKGWKPHPPPREGEETQAYRSLIVEAVRIIYEHNRQIYAQMGFPPRPVTLGEIYQAVTRKARALKRAGKWPYPIRGKRWVDRRVNEAACPDFYPDRIPRIVAASAGRYIPNPALDSDLDQDVDSGNVYSVRNGEIKRLGAG